jgi:uncharacterized protein
MNLKDKIIVITGGADGLGLSMTKELLSQGAKVNVVSRSKDKLEALQVADTSGNLKIFPCDITKENELKAVAESIGDCDIVINNAGVWLEGKIEQQSFEEISQTIDINLKGTIYTTKTFLPFMIKKGDGFILNVSSTTGLKGRENQSVYAASKFGVQGFTESLKEDLKSTNIKVAGFYPGGMNTKLFEKAGNPKQNNDWMDTDKVAKVVTFILELDDSMLLDHVVLNKRGAKSSN